MKTKTKNFLSTLLVLATLIAMLCVLSVAASASDGADVCAEHSDAGYIVFDLTKETNAGWADDVIYESGYEGYTATFPGHDEEGDTTYALESEALALSPGEEYVLGFDWGINQYYVDYGHFAVYLYHNDVCVISRSYIEEACLPVEPLTYEFTASEGGDTFRWEFEKLYNGWWADEGRIAYLGGLYLTKKGNLCSEPLTCANCGEAFVGEKQLAHDPAVALDEHGMCPNRDCPTYEDMILVTEENYEALGLGAGHVGYYAITKIGHLYRLALEVLDGNSTINAVLAADIDLSGHRHFGIGRADRVFSGLFDGNGKTVTLDMEVTGRSSGFFNYVSDAVIKNLTIDGTITTKYGIIGGFVGTADGTSVIENCISKVDIVSSVIDDATIAGFVGVNEGNLTLQNSGFVGSIRGEQSSHNAGLVAWTDGAGDTNVINCYVYATLLTDRSNCDIIGRNPYRCYVENTYFVESGYSFYGYGSGMPIAAEAEQFASGEIAYLLGSAWGQEIGKDEYPVHATATNKVYLGYDTCSQYSKFYSNDSGAVIKPEHVWDPLRGGCAVCGEALIPAAKIPTKPYLTEEELDLPIDEIRAHFNRTLAVKYENGKYMIEDIGAAFAEIFFEDALTYENGYWVVEMAEETYNAGNIMVNFSGKDGIWSVIYVDGEPQGGLQISVNYNEYVIKVYMASDWVDIQYPLFDGYCLDRYRNGVLVTHAQAYHFANSRDFFEVVYNPDKTVKYVLVHSEEEPNDDKYYCYLSPDGVWYTNPTPDADFLTDAPLGYEDSDLEFFVTLTPCIINCTHESYSTADCTNAAYCLVCGVVPEGNEPLGHDMVIDEAVDPTCTEYGYTEGTHCTRCDDMTVAQEPIDPTGHDWNDGEVTTEPTCSAMGETTYTCKNDSGHKRVEVDVAIDPDAHAWNNGEVTTEPTCAAKGETTYTCTHNGAHTYTEEIDLLEHTKETVAAKAATCTEKGLTAGVNCTECDAVLTAQTEIPALGHTYDNACDALCNTCGEARATADHVDADENRVCDVCGAELKRDGLSGGAIAGIAGGATAVAGVGGFSIFWFVIKKKRWADLFKVFKK